MTAAAPTSAMPPGTGRRPPPGRRAVRRAGRLAGWLVLGATLLVGVPDRFGGKTNYTVVAGRSMEPTYSTGDLLVGRPRGEYRPGDVVVYDVPRGEPGEGHGVVHRIIGGDPENGWVLQGDNNPEIDYWRPRDSDIRGRVAFRIPKAGYLLAYATHPMVFTILGSLVVGRLLWPTKAEQRGDRARPPAGSALAAGEGPGGKPGRNRRSTVAQQFCPTNGAIAPYPALCAGRDRDRLRSPVPAPDHGSRSEEGSLEPTGRR